MKKIIEHPKLGKIEREDIVIREILENEYSFAYGCVKQFTSGKHQKEGIKISEPEVCKEYLDKRLLMVSLLVNGDRVIWKIRCNEIESYLYRDLEDEKFVDMFRLFYADESVTPEMVFDILEIAKELNGGGDHITVIYSCGACGTDFLIPRRFLAHIRRTGHRDRFTALFAEFRSEGNAEKESI